MSSNVGNILPDLFTAVILAILAYALSFVFPDMDDNLRLAIAGSVAIVGWLSRHYVSRILNRLRQWLLQQWQCLVIAILLILIEVLLYLAYADWRTIAFSIAHFALIAVAALLLARHHILPAIASPVLVYDFIDSLRDATLRNEGAEKIRAVERALSRRPGGTEMRALYAHPGHPHENTEVTYQLPAEFAVARRLFLVFAVAILGEHPVERRGCGFKNVPANHARFEVCVNGQSVFTRVFDIQDPHLFEWEHHVIRIAEVKGRTLKVDLITNAMGNLSYIWTAWGEPKLIAIFGA